PFIVVGLPSDCNPGNNAGAPGRTRAIHGSSRRTRGNGSREAPMAYEKHQATTEFNRWSESYDRSILQWLLFGPSHRALIRRIRAVAGDRPIRILDVGCGTGVFAGRLRSAFPDARVWGVDLVAGMLDKG